VGRKKKSRKKKTPLPSRGKERYRQKKKGGGVFGGGLEREGERDSLKRLTGKKKKERRNLYLGSVKKDHSKGGGGRKHAWKRWSSSEKKEGKDDTISETGKRGGNPFQLNKKKSISFSGEKKKRSCRGKGREGFEVPENQQRKTGKGGGRSKGSAGKKCARGEKEA